MSVRAILGVSNSCFSTNGINVLLRPEVYNILDAMNVSVIGGRDGSVGVSGLSLGGIFGVPSDNI